MKIQVEFIRIMYIAIKSNYMRLNFTHSRTRWAILLILMTFFARNSYAQLEDYKQIVTVGYVNSKGKMASTNWVDSSKLNLGLTDGLHMGIRFEGGEESWIGLFGEMGLNLHLNQSDFKNNWANSLNPTIPADFWALSATGGFIFDIGVGATLNASISDNICLKPYVSIGYSGGGLPTLSLRDKSDNQLLYEEDFGTYDAFSLGWGLHNNFKIFDTWVSLSYAGRTVFSESDHTIRQPVIDKTSTTWKIHIFSYQEFKLGIDLADLI